MSAPVPRLSLHGAARRFGGRVALGPVSLEIAPGSVVAVAGPSGSGKSTLLRMLMAALAATDGAVCVDGTDMATMNRRALHRYRRRCGVIDQEWLIVPELSVHHNVVAGLVPGWPWYRVLLSAAWPVERSRVRSLLARVDLAERQWDRAADLSGGQKQRVALARALAGEPAVLFADEPTAALDPTTAAEVVALIAGEARSRGASLLVCTHHLGQVLGAVDRVIGLRNGQVVLDRAAAEVGAAALEALYEGSHELA